MRVAQLAAYGSPCYALFVFTEVAARPANLELTSVRVHWSDRIVEFFLEWFLVLLASGPGRLTFPPEELEPFHLGPVTFMTMPLFVLVCLQSLLLLWKRRTIGMLMINAHVGRSSNGEKAGPLRATLPRVILYLSMIATVQTQGGSEFNLDVLVPVTIAWALMDPSSRLLHNRLAGTMIVRMVKRPALRQSSSPGPRVPTR